MCGIAGMMPIEILAVKRKQLYEQQSGTPEEQEKNKTNIRQDSLQRWLEKWDASDKDRWIHRLILPVDGWVNGKHGEVNYYLTQILPNHGCFRAYLTGLSTRRHRSSRRGEEYPRMRNTYSSGASASLIRERNWETNWNQHLSQKPS